jgi:hypothetical protein
MAEARRRFPLSMKGETRYIRQRGGRLIDGAEMKASSIGLAAAFLLAASPVSSSSCSAAAVFRQPRLSHADFGMRRAEFGREDRHGRRTGARFRHQRGRFFGDWGAGFAGGFDYAPLEADTAPDAPSPEAFAAPATNITIMLAPPSRVSQAGATYAPPGPRIITLGAPRHISRFAKMPLVVYGRAPVGVAY